LKNQFPNCTKAFSMRDSHFMASMMSPQVSGAPGPLPNGFFGTQSDPPGTGAFAEKSVIAGRPFFVRETLMSAAAWAI
jgi:hypothetical protein